VPTKFGRLLMIISLIFWVFVNRMLGRIFGPKGEEGTRSKDKFLMKNFKIFITICVD
jgi:hypothetical protein